MTTENPAATNESISLWSEWAEASRDQREHFKIPFGHKAWSRTCGSCGQGDFLERKQQPTGNQVRLTGRGFPRLPLPVLEGQARQPRFRTPRSRVHICGVMR